MPTDTPAEGVRTVEVAGPLRPASHAVADLAAALEEWLELRVEVLELELAREQGSAERTPGQGSQVFVHRCTLSVEVKDGAPKGRKYWVQAWLGVRKGSAR